MKHVQMQMSLVLAAIALMGIARLGAQLVSDPAQGPLLLHFATGNRVGALTALKAVWLDGMTPDAALVLGRATGLTRLEPAVRAALGLG